MESIYFQTSSWSNWNVQTSSYFAGDVSKDHPYSLHSRTAIPGVRILGPAAIKNPILGDALAIESGIVQLVPWQFLCLDTAIQEHKVKKNYLKKLKHTSEITANIQQSDRGNPYRSANFWIQPPFFCSQNIHQTGCGARLRESPFFKSSAAVRLDVISEAGRFSSPLGRRCFAFRSVFSMFCE